MGATVTITGSGFDASNSSNNEVVIGTTVCDVTVATASQVTCTLNNGPTGAASVHVYVNGKGQASGQVTFTYVTGVSAFSSTPGSVQGQGKGERDKEGREWKERETKIGGRGDKEKDGREGGER